MDYLAILAVIISFAITVVLCPICIPFLHKLKFGQYIREEGPESHQKKSGTPTMGGAIFLVGIIVTSLIFIIGFKRTELLPVLLLTVGFAAVGFVDDFIKVVLKRNLGFKAWQKMLCEIVITLIFCIYLMNTVGTEIIIPFTHGQTADIGGLYIPLVFVAVLGTVNGSNFTDGLDGLASSVTAVIAFFFIIVSLLMTSGYIYISAAVFGALLAFLVFNVNPAKIFMGDTGSLALGGFVAGVAFCLKMPIFIIPVAFIYLVEILSVIIQVLYFKSTHGKRIFRMAPIHHHFELGGWSETKVVAVFTIITIITCNIAYLILF